MNPPYTLLDDIKAAYINTDYCFTNGFKTILVVGISRPEAKYPDRDFVQFTTLVNMENGKP